MIICKYKGINAYSNICIYKKLGVSHEIVKIELYKSLKLYKYKGILDNRNNTFLAPSLICPLKRKKETYGRSHRYENP